jgi:hypothetical protein
MGVDDRFEDELRMDLKARGRSWKERVFKQWNSWVVREYRPMFN